MKKPVGAKILAAKMPDKGVGERMYKHAPNANNHNKPQQINRKTSEEHCRTKLDWLNTRRYSTKLG